MKKSLSLCFASLLLGFMTTSSHATISFTNTDIGTFTGSGTVYSAPLTLGGSPSGTVTVRFTAVQDWETTAAVSIAGGTVGRVELFDDNGEITGPPNAGVTNTARVSITVTPAGGFGVVGMSLYSATSVLANPTFDNIVHNGTGTIFENPTGPDLLNGIVEGDPLNSGDTVVFNDGTTLPANAANGTSPNGWLPTANGHQNNWVFNLDGANSLQYTYLIDAAGINFALSAENIRFDIEMEVVPEPSRALLSVLGLSLLVLRRKRS